MQQNFYISFTVSMCLLKQNWQTSERTEYDFSTYSKNLNATTLPYSLNMSVSMSEVTESLQTNKYCCSL